MQPFVYLFVVALAITSSEARSARKLLSDPEVKTLPEHATQMQENKVPSLVIKPSVESVTESATEIHATTSAAPPSVENKLPKQPSEDDWMETGALMRAFFVLLGVTVIFVMYIFFRMYRLRNGSKPPVMVRKYGVLTNRGDVEMLPLPLSEDEDDDIVFESRNLNR